MYRYALIVVFFVHCVNLLLRPLTASDEANADNATQWRLLGVDLVCIALIGADYVLGLLVEGRWEKTNVLKPHVKKFTLR